MKMPLSTFREAASLAELNDWRMHYKGEGFISSCPAIVGNLSDLLRFILFVDQVARVEDDDMCVSDLAYDLTDRVCEEEDKNEWDTVYYWPNLELTD